MSTNTQTLTYHCPHCNTTIQAMPQADDEIVTCSSCQKQFKLELPAARPSDTPPQGILLPPGVEPEPAPAAQPVEQRGAVEQRRVVEHHETGQGLAPDAEQEGPAEEIALSMIRRYPIRCMMYVVAILLGIVGTVYFAVMDYPYLALIVGAVLALVIVKATTWWIRMNNTKVVITNRRCVIETGVFSREATEISRNELTNIHVSQNMVMRLMNVGDLVITSETGDKREIVIMAVPDPEYVVSKMAPPPPPPQAEVEHQVTSA